MGAPNKSQIEHLQSGNWEEEDSQWFLGPTLELSCVCNWLVRKDEAPPMSISILASSIGR